MVARMWFMGALLCIAPMLADAFAPGLVQLRPALGRSAPLRQVLLLRIYWTFCKWLFPVAMRMR